VRERVDVIRSGPDTVETQFGGFKSILLQDYCLEPSAAEVPYFTASYAAQTVAHLCERVPMAFCD